ncbi:hypothetical protein C8035_v003272 [Colletotrichum spinosum]|uniref:Uncharacterized protein n=1 Tax=Colletotrichum spinosum TaxID=1347390 RepID=A0A4R8QKF7_9PEZI|nr:hypothetical protein C8035_v003272 [Colletotrichum spinosum]
MDGLRSSSATYTNHQIDVQEPSHQQAQSEPLKSETRDTYSFVPHPPRYRHHPNRHLVQKPRLRHDPLPKCFLLFTLFAAYWGWIATAVCDRQPFIELTKPSGADASASVLLDYRFVPIYWRWWSAFKRSHATVGSTVLLALFLTYLIQPLSARLFAPQTVLLTNFVPLAFAARYYASRIGANMDWRPIMSAVAATKLYNGGRIPWTDEQRPYRPFRAAAATDGDARVNGNTSAYAAYLSCEVGRDYSMTLNRRSSTSGTITMTGKDHGRDFEQEFGTTSSREMYFKTTTQLECAADAFLSRLVFTAGTFPTSSQNLLGNVSVISCATGYRSQPSVLTVSGAPASSSSSSTTAATIHSFAPVGEAVTDRPVLWRVFEDGIFSTTAFGQGAEWTTTDFGSLALYLAQKRAPAGFLGAEVLAQSISDISSQIRQRSGWNGKTRKAGKNMSEVKDRKWMALRDEANTRRVICSDPIGRS